MGPIWSLSGTADLASYISKLTDGKTAVEMGTFHFTNEDWHEPAKRGTTRQDYDENGQAILIVHGDAQHMGRRIADYLKKLAKTDINGLVLVHTGRIGKPATSVRFKDTTSRWGSCTSKGDLAFSWRIMMAPAEVINYLVAHEVAHLIEMNHGPDFWALCTKLCPDTPTSRAWLKRHGSALHAVSFASVAD